MMNLVNFANKSALVVVGSVLALSACSKKNNDQKKDDGTTKISQPYNKNNQIIADAQGGADGANVSCSGTEKLVFQNHTMSENEITFNGVYSKKIVNFTTMTSKDKNGEVSRDELDPLTIVMLCGLYTEAKMQGGEITDTFTSCTDDSGKTYQITSSTPVSGAQLWCAR